MSPSRPSRLNRLVSAAATAALLTAACAGTGSGSGGTSATAPPDAVQVVIAASPEKVTLLTDLAGEFNAREVQVDGRPVFVKVQKTSSGTGADLLVDDWPETAGDRPTVYSPAASLWGTVVNERRVTAGKAAIVPKEFRPIMLTPVVIAMPEPMAQALGWPDTPIGWGDVAALAQDPQGWARFGHPEWGRFKLGKTDPHISTTGFNATIAAAYAGAGKQRDLSVADVESPQVQQFLSQLEASIVHYGDTTLTFLDNLKRADDRGAATAYISAVAVEEVSVIDYNQGDPTNVLPPGETGPAPKTKLVSVYPKEGTLWSDNPYFVLEAPWVDESEAVAARLFGDFVGEAQNQEKVLAYGFRPGNPDVAIGAPIDAEHGADPTQPKTILPVPPGPTLTALLGTWEATRKPARVLLVMDVSGSMGDRAGPGRETKLELAKKAAGDALGLFADRDEVGLWVFSTELDGQKDYQEVVPIAPVATNRTALQRTLAGLTPLNGTGLYDTTEAAYDKMRTVASPDRITAVVLLTDGRNEDQTNDDLDALVEHIGGEGAGGQVRIFAIAYGKDASVEQLQRITEATNGKLYDSQNPADIASVFRNVISNF